MLSQIAALRSGLDEVPVPAVLTDLVTGLVVHLNGAAARLLGAPAARLTGVAVDSLIGHDQACADFGAAAALAAGTLEACQMRGRPLHRADGSAVEVDISGKRVSSGGVHLALWILAPSRQRTPRDPSTIPSAFLAITDHEWQFEYVSVDATVLGGTSDGLIGSPLLGLVHPTSAAELLDAASRAAAQGTAIRVRPRLRASHDEWRTRDCLVVPMCRHDPPRLGLTVTAVDRAGTGALAAIPSALHERRFDTSLARDTLDQVRRRAQFPELSARQHEILTMVVAGAGVDVIAASLFLSPSTVRNHLTAIYKKFGAASRADLLTHLLHLATQPDAHQTGGCSPFEGSQGSTFGHR